MMQHSITAVGSQLIELKRDASPSMMLTIEVLPFAAHFISTNGSSAECEWESGGGEIIDFYFHKTEN